MILLDFEKEIINSQKGVPFEVSDAEINEKYEKGEARIITEQGAVKLSLVNQVFNSENYELQPKYQRRITWDSKTFKVNRIFYNEYSSSSYIYI